jgi:hypothetical protein
MEMDVKSIISIDNSPLFIFCIEVIPVAACTPDPMSRSSGIPCDG